MESIIPTNEYTEFEGRAYLNPQVGIDESNKFIDNLRATQTQQNQEIANQTRMLGTDVPSVQGGLIGPESYFTSRYQTPQTNAVVSNLRSAAQAAALNQALQNEQAIWKKRYQDAYNNYQKRAWNRGNPSGGGGGGNDEGEDPDFVGTGDLTGLTAEQDTNDYVRTSTIFDSTQVAGDNRSTERDKKIQVYRDNNGNVSEVIVNGTPHYGREARARYRYLKNAGLVK